MIAGKYYEKNLEDSVKLSVNAKAIIKLGDAMLPFTKLAFTGVERTAAQADIDR